MSERPSSERPSHARHDAGPDATAAATPGAHADGAGSSIRKWGEPVMAQGFVILPSALLRFQSLMFANCAEFATMLQIIEHWWQPDRRPYPSKGTLGDRMGLSQRQVQRHLARLEEVKLLRRIPRFSGDGRSSNAYDLSGLVRRLEHHASDPALRRGRRWLDRETPEEIPGELDE